MVTRQKPFSILLSLISLIAIVAIAWLVNHHAFEPRLAKTEIYRSAEIRYSPVRDIDVSSFLVRELTRKKKDTFFFAASTPQDLNAHLLFTSPSKLKVSVEPDYNDSGCNDGGINQAYIRFLGNTIDHRINLDNPLTKSFYFRASKDQTVNISIKNRLFPDCGKALVTFEKHNDSDIAALIFTLIWLLIFLICISFQTSTLIAVLGISFNALLIWAEITLGSLSYISIGTSIGLSLFLTGGLFVFTALPVKSKMLAVLFSLLLMIAFLIPTTFIAHQEIFQAALNNETIHAILQSYLGQMVEFWGEFIGFKNTLFGVLAFIIITKICMQLNQYKSYKLLSASIGLLLILIGSVTAIINWQDNRTLNLVGQSIKEYRYEINKFQSVSKLRAQKPIAVKQSSAFAENTTVFVIGESVNRSHMSSYGYVRKTTPNFDQRIADGNVIRFSNVFSSHVHSNPSISYLLTQANQYNTMKWSESPSILNITNAASVESTWFTNHRLLGGWSNYITSIAQDAGIVKTINNKIGFGNRATNHDGDLLPLWRKAISNNPKQASFLHFYNSHLDYCGRFPDSAKKFTDKVSRVYFGEWFANRKVSSDDLNCYDNSIFYTDVLLEEVIQSLDNSPRPSVLVYIPDHADDVLQARFHNAVLFTYAMTTVPLFIWANDEWRQQHSDLWQNMLQNKEKAFTNDLLFESMSGLLGIQSVDIDPSFDFSSKSFNPPKLLQTIHGRRALDAIENWRYWQPLNAQSLINQKLKLGATNIDSVAKAKIALDLGFELLQLNINYSEKGSFQLADKDFVPIGIDLGDFISTIDQQQFEIVINIVNQEQQVDIATLNTSLDTIATTSNTKITIDTENSARNAPALADHNLLQQSKIMEHNKSKVLMLSLITQFDIAAQPLEPEEAP